MKSKLLIISLCWLACLAGSGTALSQPGPKIKLALSQTNFPKNKPIGVALLIYATKDIEATFNSSQIYDLVLESNGKTVWQWSNGRMFAQSIVKKTISADNPLLYSIVIDPGQIKSGLKPGKYSLTPVLCLAPQKITGEPVGFEIQ